MRCKIKKNQIPNGIKFKNSCLHYVLSKNGFVEISTSVFQCYWTTFYKPFMNCFVWGKKKKFGQILHSQIRSCSLITLDYNVSQRKLIRFKWFSKYLQIKRLNLLCNKWIFTGEHVVDTSHTHCYLNFFFAFSHYWNLNEKNNAFFFCWTWIFEF